MIGDYGGDNEHDGSGDSHIFLRRSTWMEQLIFIRGLSSWM